LRRPFVGLASQLLLTLGGVFLIFALALAWTVQEVRRQVDQLLQERLEALDDWSDAADRAVARLAREDHEALVRLMATGLGRDLGRGPRLVELAAGRRTGEVEELLPAVLGGDPAGLHAFELSAGGGVRRLSRGPAVPDGFDPSSLAGPDDDWEAGRWLAGEELLPGLGQALVYVGREERGRRLVVAFEAAPLMERLARYAKLEGGVELVDADGSTVLEFARGDASARSGKLAEVRIEGTPWTLTFWGRLHTHAGPETVKELDLQGPLDRAKKRVFATVGGTFLFSLIVVALLLHFRLTVPARRLREDIRIVTRGNLEHPIDVAHAAELGALADQFSELTAQLRATRDRLREYNRTLERSVQERTAELNARNLELSRAYREKEHAYVELQTTQAQLLHQERMATLGQLLAGIAHEINNPVNFMVNAIRPLEDNVRRIQGVLQLLIEQYGDVLGPVAGRTGSGVPDLDQVMEDIQQSIRLIRTGADRTSSIIANLRTFSRTREEELSLVDLASCLDVTLALLAHETKGRIEVLREYEPVPAVECCRGRSTRCS